MFVKQDQLLLRFRFKSLPFTFKQLKTYDESIST